jgi:hypothetical protein
MTLYPKRSSAILLLLTCSAFVAIGIWMGTTGKAFGYLCAAFFGLGVPIAVIQLIPGSTFLHIDSNGITFSNLFRKTSMSWSVFQEFYVVTMKQNGLTVRKMVGFNFAPSYDRARAGRAVAKLVADCEGALPDTYGKKAEELAELLNARLGEARSQPGTAR